MITPAEFSRLANHLRDDLEKEIDKALKANAAVNGGSSPIRLATRLFSRRLSAEDFNVVLGHYSAAGWKCSYVTDPRDGDFLEFEV